MTSPTTDRRLGLVGNTPLKAPVTAIATSNVVQAGEQTIDGAQVHAINAAGVPDRVLCVGQTDPKTNGIWDVSTAAWTRSPDADGNYDLTNGSQVMATSGTHAYQLWVLNTASPITIGTTPLSWSIGMSNSFLSTLGASGGSSLMGFIQPYTGSVGRTVQDTLRDDVRVKDVGGAVFDDATDDTAAIQAAINGAAITAPDAFDGLSPAVILRFPTRSKVLISGTLYVPSFVHIDLNGSRLRGIGSNTCFESGYWNGGTVVTNFGQTNETKFAVGTQICNGELRDFNKGFHLFNFCENSVVDNIRFVRCNQAVYAKRCFYSTFTRLHSRTPLDGTAFPCFHFDDSVNAITIQSNFAVSYTTGWKFSGVKQNASMVNCGAEQCATGVLVSDPTSNLQIRSCYFEGVTNAINCDGTGNHENVYVTGCWINNCTNAITSNTLISGEFSANNELNGATIQLPANFANRARVAIPADTTATNTTAVLPANYSLGDTVVADYVKAIYDSGSGLVTNKARVENGVIPFHYSGTAGIPKTGTVPFGTVTLATTTVTVDMPNLNFTNFDHYVYALTVTDNGSTVNLSGRVAFGTAQGDSGFSGKTVTASANSGKLRLVVSGLTLGQACTGIVRHA